MNKVIYVIQEQMDDGLYTLGVVKGPPHENLDQLWDDWWATFDLELDGPDSDSEFITYLLSLPHFELADETIIIHTFEEP